MCMRVLLSFLLFIVFVGSVFGQSTNGLLKIKENGKWGLYDFTTSKVIVEPKYDRIGQRSTWGIKTIQDNKVGMVSYQGELISEPKFKDIHRFSSEIYAVTLLDGTKNILDITTGKIILPRGDYDVIWSISNDYFTIHKNGLVRIMNKYGKYTTAESYLKLSSDIYLKEHALSKIENGKKGIIRLQDGAIIVPHQYSSIDPFNETYSKFKIDSSGFGIMNHLQHQIILEDEYASIRYLGEEYFILNDLDNVWSDYVMMEGIVKLKDSLQKN